MTAVHRHPRIPLVAFGLLLTAIFAAGLLVVRSTRLPAVTLVPVFLASLFGAPRVLPEARHGYAAEWLVVPAELLLLGYVALRVRRAAAVPTAGRADLLERLRATLRALLPAPAADIAAHEAALLHYALLAWRARPDVRAGEMGFSYHRANGYGGVLAAVGLAAVLETVGVHLLVERWSAAAAWVLTALSLYGIVWLAGHFQAVRLRPVLLTPDALHVRIGLLWNVRVPYGEIAALGAAGAGAPDRHAPGYLHAVTLGPARLVVELRGPVRVDGPYGFVKKVVRRIGLAVDERERFRAELAGRVDAAPPTTPL